VHAIHPKCEQEALMIGRRPPLRTVGTDPDYRFTLANERTFLAWLRTGLALLAGAIALASLVHNFGPRSVRIAITVFLLILSVTVVVGAYVRWDRTERALRENRSLPTDPMPRVIVAGVAIVVAAAAVLIFLAETGR
jgi:putative membrane protein